MALVFTAVIGVLEIAGSLWVMYNLNRYMMPAPMAVSGPASPLSGDMGGM